LAATAEADLQEILRWTAERFGEKQARVYAETLAAALDDLTEGPCVLGAKARDDIAEGILSLHVARSGRKGRHLVAFRVGRTEDGDLIDVLRILHEAMDLPRHLRGS
jgi:toxin ParE1/3/4